MSSNTHRNTAEKRRPTERYAEPVSKGLSSAQVKRHKDDGWVNTPVKNPSKTVPEIIIGNLFTYFNLVFALLAVLLVLAGSFKSLTFVPVVFANLLIGIVQEIRAKRQLDKLAMLNEPKVLVIRDGREQTVPADLVVLDDIAVFRAGNQICADAIVLEGEASVNESLLTGESDEIPKKAGDTLMSGSFVVSGQCFARLERVGADSYISGLTMQAKAGKSKEQSEMIRALDKLVAVLGVLIIPIGVLLFVQQYVFGHESFSNSIVSMVAAVIGMIPEGLYLLTSIALVVSVIRLSSRRVLVHDMKCIETLARVDVLCVDKTGTITENEMRVSGVVPLEPGAIDLNEQLGAFVSAMSSDNATMAAMKLYFREPTFRKPLSISPFSSVYKYCGVRFPDRSFVLGAPEFVLRDRYERYRDTIERYGEEGCRVVLFAEYDGIPDGKALTGEVHPLGLVLLANPIRKSAPRTFRYFREQGVEVKVISGDNPVTVSRISVQAGIAGADNFVDASTLLTPEDVEKAALQYTVFGRVTPEQKRILVGALKKAGKTVGMTGDGVNDVLALKDADCSVAMASGCDAAAHVSQLVLLDSDFARMPSVVAEGRRVVNNIERSASLFLVKNIFSILLAVLAICVGFVYPLVPSQVSLVSMFTIGIPAFFLALQPNKNIIRGKFMTNVMLRALPAGLTDFVSVGLFVFIGSAYQLPGNETATVCTMILAAIGFMMLYHTSQPMNRLRWILFGFCIAGYLFCGLVFNNLFSIDLVSAECIVPFLVILAAAESLLRNGTRISRWIEKTLKAKAEKRRTEKNAAARKNAAAEKTKIGQKSN